MFGTHHLPLFLLSAITLSLIPGPSTLYIVGRSVSQGRAAGVLSVLGIAAGSLCHVAAVAFGLSALLAASQAAFGAIKYAGAAYLIYLGMQTLRAKASPGEVSDDAAPRGRGPAFRQGLVTQILNPKVSLFFLAILPQFVAPGQAHSPLPFLFLGLLFVGMDTAWFLCVAAFSASLSGWLRRSARFGRALKWATGTLYIGLGLSLLRLRARAAS